MTVTPALLAVFTTARITALRPGASPPPVRTPSFLIVGIEKVASRAFTFGVGFDWCVAAAPAPGRRAHQRAKANGAVPMIPNVITRPAARTRNISASDGEKRDESVIGREPRVTLRRCAFPLSAFECGTVHSDVWVAPSGGRPDCDAAMRL